MSVRYSTARRDVIRAAHVETERARRLALTLDEAIAEVTLTAGPVIDGCIEVGVGPRHLETKWVPVAEFAAYWQASAPINGGGN